MRSTVLDGTCRVTQMDKNGYSPPFHFSFQCFPSYLMLFPLPPSLDEQGSLFCWVICENAPKFSVRHRALSLSPTTDHTGVLGDLRGIPRVPEPSSASQTNRKWAAVLIYVISEAGPCYLGKMATLLKKLFPQVSRGKETFKVIIRDNMRAKSRNVSKW